MQDFWDAMNGGSPVAEADFYTTLQTYIETTQTGQDQFNQNLIGLIQGKLKYMRIEALSPEGEQQGYDDMIKIYDQWEEIMKSYNNGSPDGMDNAYQSAGFTWAWLATQEELVTGAIQGITISLTFSFIVLVCSTLNIIAAIYSIICITCIVITVIGSIQMIGWQLGVLEAVAVVIIVGFSVDYVVHLANHYVESVYIDRFRRMKDSLTGIGISIVSGAITTILSGIFLFLATIIFFENFAILILITISSSILFSLIAFAALNHWVGPSGNFGNLKYHVITPLFEM